MTTADSSIDRRVGKLETSFELQRQELQGVKSDVGEVAQNLRAFRDEWGAKADEDRKAHRNARLTMPQIVGMMSAAAVLTGMFLGGIMWLITVQVASVRSELAAQVGQVGLTVRGQVDGMTATQGAIQSLSRDIGDLKVKLGLVEQVAAFNREEIVGLRKYDAQMARLDERITAGALAMRTIGERKPP